MRMFWGDVPWQFGPPSRLWMGFFRLGRYAACLAHRGPRSGPCSPAWYMGPGEQPGWL